MKVAILCLFALVAVSQAAFTANLQQRAAPVLAKTFSQMRLRSDGGMQTTLFETLQQHAEELIAQITSGVASAAQVWAEVTSIIGQLQDLGGSALEVATGLLSDLWAAVFGRQKSFSLDSIFESLANLVAEFNIPEFIEGALGDLFSSNVVQQILSALFGRQRGIFGDLISGVQGHLQGLATQVAEMIQNILPQLQDGLASVQEMAAQFVADAQAQLGALANSALQALLSSPAVQQMTGVAQQVVAAIQNLIGNNRF